MRVAVITSSSWIVVATIDDRGRCAVRDELDLIVLDDRDAHAQIIAVLGRVAVTGPPKDERRSRHLDDGIFELKTPRRSRLIYFFGPRRTMVCTDICKKPGPTELRRLIRRARDFRETYLAASAGGDIVIEIGG